MLGLAIGKTLAVLLALRSPASIPVLQPQSHFASSIFELSIWLLYVCLGVFILVAGAVTYASWRFRASPDEPDPLPVFGSLKWEIVYLTGPVLLLAVIFVFTIRVMGSSDPPSHPGPDDIVIVGHQWWWEVRYPKTGLVTANEIHIPAGHDVQLGLESADVIHDFWVPELGRKIDLIPGRHANIWIGSNHSGTYLGVCAEFCGQEHAWMRLRVIADDAPSFESWTRNESRAAPLPVTGQQQRGLAAITQLPCVNCHTITGTSARGLIGPNLTHLASRHTLAAGRLANTPEQLSAWLRNPDEFKPGSHMPNLRLTDSQLGDIVAYLETLQ